MTVIAAQQPKHFGQALHGERGLALELHPTECVWANLKNGLGNLTACRVDDLAAIVKNRLKRIQYRPELIPGFLAQPGLSLNRNRRKPRAGTQKAAGSS